MDRSAELAPDEAMLVERGCLLIIYAAGMAHAANVTALSTPDALEDCRQSISKAPYADELCERLRNTTEKGDHDRIATES
jgi:hypothetical protein